MRTNDVYTLNVILDGNMVENAWTFHKDRMGWLLKSAENSMKTLSYKASRFLKTYNSRKHLTTYTLMYSRR